MKIFLVGFMGSGKTTLGVELEEHYHVNLMEADWMLAGRFNKSIANIFELEGEEFFRKAEHELLQALIAQEEDCIVDCGGGMPCYFDAMAAMNAAGTTVYLKLSSDLLFSRLRKEIKQRPLLAQQEDLQGYITDTLKQREPYYSQAKHTVIVHDGDTIAEVKRRIVAAVDGELGG